MSSPAQGGPSVPKEKEKRGLGKVLQRVKTVWKKNGPSKRNSMMSPTEAGPSTTAAATTEGVTTRHSEPAPAPAVAKETQQPPAAPDATRVPRSQIFEERAKKICERYGLELKPNEWLPSEGHALRVEKPIRMRVHRKCHVCDTAFGLGKDCPKCKHTRCKSCPRLPPKRTEAEKEESRKKRAAIMKERAENPPIIPDWDPSDKKVVLRRPAKSGGQDLVHKRPRQRVRRTCCECERQFSGGNKSCDNCQHVRCTDCPRDPPKKDKYPYGYPGDEPGKRSGYFECHECKNIFHAVPSAEVDCPKCAHHGSGKRMTPRKVDPEPDPEVWKNIQTKLEELSLKHHS
ncbi:hypothetical protein QBC46DRAFT_145840 [Diplogelasinospora grovesii]|uniref:Uncharacterized protein n=1 Tax=Diplogelasinospora grovesii TaxID=303347 RepID=A0AAN6NFE3_9PEZI|nr:hypothetical protein QBC46DRAFT_145840 [Diplogelasinospora grovesii]